MIHPALDPWMNPLRVAIHESGHAVAAVRLGLDFHSVTTDPKRLLKCQGGVANIDPENGPVEDHIVSYLAAYFAERKSGISSRLLAEGGAEADFRSVRQNLHQASAPLRTLVRRAEDLVNKEWGAILNVAFELSINQYLDCEQVGSILETRNCPRKQPPALPVVDESLDLRAEEERWVASLKAIHRRCGKRQVQLMVRLRGYQNEQYAAQAKILRNIAQSFQPSA